MACTCCDETYTCPQKSCCHNSQSSNYLTCQPPGNCTSDGGDDGGDTGGGTSTYLRYIKLLKPEYDNTSLETGVYGDEYNPEWNWDEYDEFIYSENFEEGEGIRFTAHYTESGNANQHGLFLERKLPNPQYDASLPGNGGNCDNAIHIDHGLENNFDEENIFF